MTPDTLAWESRQEWPRGGGGRGDEVDVGENERRSWWGEMEHEEGDETTGRRSFGGVGGASQAVHSQSLDGQTWVRSTDMDRTPGPIDTLVAHDGYSGES